MDLTRRQALLLILVVIGALGFLVVADQLVERVSPWNYDDFEREIDRLGVWGPIIYMLFFAASMVVAPVPTGPAPLAAAAAFGGLAAFFYTLGAGSVGAALCFAIARRWGRPALARYLPQKMAVEIDRSTDRLGVRVLFLLRLFPILGVDIVSYAAGLTRMRFRTYAVISVAGSVPSLALLSVAGEGAADNRLLFAAGLAGFGALMVLPLLYYALRKRRPTRAAGAVVEPGAVGSPPADGD